MSDLSLAGPSARLSPPREVSTLNVLAETAYPSSVASARVRVASFIPFLRDEGVSVAYSPALTDREYRVVAEPGRVIAKVTALGRSSVRSVVRPVPPHDLLLIHRLRLLNPLPGFDPPRRLDVFDLDDALFVRFEGGVNSRFRWAKQEASRCIECLRRAKLVLAGNSFLAGHASEYAHRVEVMPSCVDTSRQPLRIHEHRSPVTIGWIGSPTTSRYLKPLLPVLARLNAGQLRARLVLVGADTRITAPWIQHHPWTLDSERDLLASFDIGIMPQTDDPWARGKCGYKVLQYFAAGVPAIASPVGVAPDLIGQARGLLAGTPEQWHDALVAMIEDPARRRESGAAARGFVESEYSYQRWAPELAALLRSVAG